MVDSILRESERLGEKKRFARNQRLQRRCLPYRHENAQGINEDFGKSCESARDILRHMIVKVEAIVSRGEGRTNMSTVQLVHGRLTRDVELRLSSGAAIFHLRLTVFY